jgi:hypothetical protein
VIKVFDDPPIDKCERERERQSIARPLQTDSNSFSRRLGLEIEGEITGGACALSLLFGKGGGRGIGRGKRAEGSWAVHLEVCSGRTISSVGLAAKLAMVTSATPSTSRAPPTANNLHLRMSREVRMDDVSSK